MHIQPRITDLFKSIPTNTPRSNKIKNLQSTPWSLKSKKSTTTNIEQSRKSLFGKERENKEDDKLLQILNDIVDIENQPSTSTSLIEKQQISTTTIIQQNEEIIEIDEQEINIVEITQQQKQQTVKKNKKPEKSKMVKQREAKRLAISQHFFRRLNRADYDLNKQSLVRKTWKENGFSQWLNYLKDLWRFQYLARKREEETLEVDNSLANIPSTSTAILGGGPVVKRKHCWQIIQILETKFPGQFTLFALVDDIIRRINLIVPRTVYVDDIEIRQNSIGQLVQKLLPRQRPSANLYEFCIDEAVFSTKMIDLNVQMCLMRINGIYETKIPLMFKTIFHSGVNCNIDGKNVNNELSLEQINKIDNPSIFQFSDFNFSTLPIIYLYEYLHSGRLILSLFMPKFGKAFIFVVNREPVDLLNLNNFYLNELNRFINQKLIKEDEFIGLEQCKKISLIETYQNASIKDCSRQLSKLITSLKLTNVEPFLLLIQSNRLTKQLLKDFPSLVAFPNVTLKVTEPSNLMNILDWANTIVKRSVQHFFICFTYLKEYWSFSSYLEIPIGNLPEDVPSFGLDILFARQLKTKNYLLWASPSLIPDFGGKDLDDLRLSNEWENCSFTGKCFGGGGENYLINKEIFEAHYITAEISIGALAVTALLQSVKISEAEGTSEYIGFTCNKLSTLSIEELINCRVGGKYINDCIAVNGELACLREMFHRLVRDIHYRKNLIADQLVINMHRWICDPNSLLFNPAIKNALTILMKKLCLLLVAEMQRLGAKVIYCSFRKIVFSTQRHSLPFAKSFVNSLLIEINQKPIFASLQLGLIHFSSVLLWIDSSNYAYVYASEDEKRMDVSKQNLV
uniref:DNA polymerase epsilon catalytic subunit n=1 Tax=Meloidogyne enterolobii TaxID=390850 RepID=A0A6V7V6E6_MELEN|nr:unnamed protein product [Meloidogyne enterolobii]